MPYTCTSCGRYQQGHSADGICPASECQPARQAKAAAEKAATSKGTGTVITPHELSFRNGMAVERAAIVAWLRTPGGDPYVTHELAQQIEAGEHLKASS
jgi:hypothetical protein